ncbi:YqaE/Pmp3 family membrane protein [Bacillus gaemokensis]|uniref:Hemolysin BL lytic component L2 n=1 Tax=Bacillus gaemokensis TaxID=574375 RepID=A0A073KBX3_9BACI|nr:YqaE/Pmp3 family membrane protein [Bacillus gaemokensis]KEK24016.1 hemolysin BL lytic component L2 [Bacillus gaemokensis]KYG27221.1 hemolysin BL lytic component L2 [Bacillus gaemokensis]
MMYLLAILFPPLAVLLCGKPFQAIINFFLTLIVWVPGVIHAILVVSDKKADRRLTKQIKAYDKINNRNKN